MDNFNMSKDEAEWVEFGQSLQQVTATRNKVKDATKKYKHKYKSKYSANANSR